MNSSFNFSSRKTSMFSAATSRNNSPLAYLLWVILLVATLLSVYRVLIREVYVYIGTDLFSGTGMSAGSAEHFWLLSFLAISMEAIIIWFFLRAKNLFTFIQPSHLVLMILSFSALLRLLWIFFFPTYPTMDAHSYYIDAVKIAENSFGYFSDAANTPYWPVGLKIFGGIIFKLFGSKIIWIKFATIFLHLWAEYLLYKIAELLFDDPRVSLGTLVLFAFYPNQIFYGGGFWTETLYTSLFLFSSLLLFKADRRSQLQSSFNQRFSTVTVMVSGVFWALTALVRPTAPIYPLLYFFLKFVFGKKRHLAWGQFCLNIGKQIFLLYLTFFVTLSPWIARNYLLYDKFILISDNGPMVIFVRFVLDNDENKLEKILKPHGPVDPKDMGAYTIKYILNNPIDSAKVVVSNIYSLYSNDFDGVEIAGESLLPESMAPEIFSRVKANVNSWVNLVDLSKVYVQAKGYDHQSLSAATKELPYVLVSGLSEREKIDVAHTLRYTYAYPYREKEGTTLKVFKFINSVFYYWVLFACAIFTFFLVGYFQRRLLNERRFEIVFGGGVILLTSLIHALTTGGARYHFPLMPWMFLYFALYLKILFLGEFRYASR